MRIYLRKKTYFKILYLKKVVLIFVIALVVAVLLSSVFTGVLKPYIESLAIGRSNYILQNTINKAVLTTLNTKEYDSFVRVIKNREERITGIETNTVAVNLFKSNVVCSITDNLNKIRHQKFAIPLFSFLNNPFFSEKGPALYIKILPIGTINADIKSTFISVGVNQTKHQVDLHCQTEIRIALPLGKINHKVSATVPISQTVIVGEVPQSYTNVETPKEKFDDTVLQLAGN